MAEGTGFEPVIMESKSNALGRAKLTPNNTGQSREIRTPDRVLRRHVLYPTELWTDYNWCIVRDSNSRQPACKAGTLPTELTMHGGDDRDRTCCDISRKIYSLLPYHYGGISIKLAPVAGIEPTTN